MTKLESYQARLDEIAYPVGKTVYYVCKEFSCKCRVIANHHGFATLVPIAQKRFF